MRCLVCNGFAKRNYWVSSGCPECPFAKYCSAECLETDIVPHRLICKAFKRFCFSVPPKEDSKFGVWFPVKGGTPVFFWLECEDRPWGEPACGRTFPKLQRGQTFSRGLVLNLPKDHPAAHRTLLQCNEYRAYDLDHTLALYPDAAYTASIQRSGIVNRCVSKFTKGTPFADYWRGPLFVLSMDTPRHALDKPQYRYMTLQDFRFIIDYFRYRDEPSPFQAPSPHNELAISNRVLGVRITCEVERQHSRSPEKYVSVRIPRDHRIFSTTATQITRTIGLPLLMTQSVPPFILELRPQIVYEGARFLNHEAAFLHRITDIDDVNWGLAAKEWPRPEGIGSVLVARADGKDIKPRQLGMIVDFCAALESYIIKARYGDEKYSKEKVMTDLMTMETFHSLFNWKKEELSKKDPSWKSVKSPYFD
jgi:hypothetical protein